MNPEKHSTVERRKRGQTKPGSGRGILIAERRKHRRFSVELPLDYSVENKEHYGGIAANASRGGLVAYLPVAITVGTLLNMEILFVNGFQLSSVRARARVIWSHLATKVTWGEYRYGLEFERLQDGDVQRLKTLLRQASQIG